MDATEPVAVLGAGGTMGYAMARNLARAGFEVRAWNRSREKAEPLVDHGASVCDTPAEAAAGAGVVLTMLADGDAVIESIQAAMPVDGENAIWVQMSTIGEAGTERCIELAEEHGITFVDAPVLGTKQPAEEGKLVILASGPDEVRDRLQPIFAELGRKTMWIGAAGAGTRLKVAANSWVLTVVEGAAETIARDRGTRSRSFAAVRCDRRRCARSPIPANQGEGDPRAQLRARLPARARRQGCGSGRGIRQAPRSRPADVQRDPVADGRGREGARRRGHERHIPDQRPCNTYTGRGPTKAWTSIDGDLIAVVLPDILTKGERSLVAEGRTDLVLAMRKAYQDTIREEVIAGVEQLTGRTVIAFLSDNHIDPDIAVESIVLEPD